MIRGLWSKKWFRITLILFILFVLIPVPKDSLMYSHSLYSKENILLSARVSKDGQWCLPVTEKLPSRFENCIIEYEDAWFYFHPGINPVSLFKALTSYLRTGKIKRGGSTIPMQVMRIRYKNSERNVLNKALESVSAIKYSLTNSKSRVLKDWAQIAPFGGNTIGAKSASLRYFGRDLNDLSWGEYALLAVMPNSPTSANLKSNRPKLLKKRNFLLNKLCDKGYFPKADLSIYLDEELPETLKQIPDAAPFFLDFLIKKHPDEFVFRSTCQAELQYEMVDIAEKEIQFLQHDDIRNIAAVVIDLEKNELLSYVGNSKSGQSGKRNFVDVVQAPRSYGSLLKPFLYSYAVDRGFILPQEILYDIPTAIGDFTPRNFDEKFRGAVRADETILQSLNVPAVRLLNQIGLAGFYEFISRLRPTFLDKGADHYGLSLILGGGETTLWDMSRLYKGLAQNYLGKSNPFGEVIYLEDKKMPVENVSVEFSPSAISSVISVMADVNRPREDRFWFKFENEKKIAWKTGTSYGHRDAWSIGFNGKYVVAVWIGNENGEGRHDLTGISKAAPFMFQIFNALPENKWFASPPRWNKNKYIKVCRESGKLAGTLCKHKDKYFVERESFQWQQCRMHTEILINEKGFLTSPQCAKESDRKDTLFTLPPEVEYYFRESNLFYKGMPATDPDCDAAIPSLSIIYPQENVKIFIPRHAESGVSSVLAKAHHTSQEAVLYWYLDDKYLKTSPSGEKNRVCAIQPLPGKHRLTVIDNKGYRSEVSFEVLEKE
jgi:penicillin-binding protein 1C